MFKVHIGHTCVSRLQGLDQLIFYVYIVLNKTFSLIISNLIFFKIQLQFYLKSLPWLYDVKMNNINDFS